MKKPENTEDLEKKYPREKIYRAGGGGAGPGDWAGLVLCWAKELGCGCRPTRRMGRVVVVSLDPDRIGEAGAATKHGAGGGPPARVDGGDALREAARGDGQRGGAECGRRREDVRRTADTSGGGGSDF